MIRQAFKKAVMSRIELFLFSGYGHDQWSYLLRLLRQDLRREPVPNMTNSLPFGTDSFKAADLPSQCPYLLSR